MQINPSPPGPIPIYCGGHSRPALRRAARLCDGWLAAQAYAPEDAWLYLDRMKDELDRVGRLGELGSSFRVYLALNAAPDVDLYRRFEDAGVTDMICAPWMMAEMSSTGDYRSSIERKLAAVEAFANDTIAKMS
jgi:alkanesulfonate monooxygenase SsuD/methylene tetrahydromethanopterin reductase-like flavin-dependent oxidoreductase (luciferase family)